MNNSWFSHDSNARNSKKLIRLRQKLGASGYGTYWMLLERLREEDSYTSERDYAMIAFDLRVDEETIRSVVEDFGLFEVSEDGKYFHAPGLDERMSAKDVRATAGRKGAESRWGGRKDENPATMAQNGKTMANEILPYGKTIANENLPYGKPMANDDFANGIREEKSKEERREENNIIYNNNNSCCSSQPSVNEEQQQQFFLSLIFFKNWGKPQAELRKFINYNNTGDRCWSRMSFEQRQSALELWKQTPATSPRMAENALSIWHKVYNTLIAIRAPADILKAALADNVDVQLAGEKLYITCDVKLQKFIEANARHLRSVLIPPEAPDRRINYLPPKQN